MKDTGKIILAAICGIVVGAKLQDLINLKRFDALNQRIRSLKASENQAIDERNEFAEKAAELRRDNLTLKYCNDTQGMLLIEQQREIKRLKGQLYN